MFFDIDNQSIKDLEILPDKSTYMSVFSLFNHVNTSEAKNLMLELITSPISDIDLIEKRRN